MEESTRDADDADIFRSEERRVISDLNKLRYIPGTSSTSADDSNGDSRAAAPGGGQSPRGVGRGAGARGARNMNVIYLRYKVRETGFPPRLKLRLNSSTVSFHHADCLRKERGSARGRVGINSTGHGGGC